MQNTLEIRLGEGSEGGYFLVQLELVGTKKNKDAIFLVENEDDVSSDQAIQKINKILNHKSKEQMHYAYRNNGMLNEKIKRKQMMWLISVRYVR